MAQAPPLPGWWGLQAFCSQDLKLEGLSLTSSEDAEGTQKWADAGRGGPRRNRGTEVGKIQHRALWFSELCSRGKKSPGSGEIPLRSP